MKVIAALSSARATEKSYTGCPCEACLEAFTDLRSVQSKLSSALAAESGETPALVSTLANQNTEKEEPNDRS